jgi:L-threonylcarbamoyladenylate synthase
MDKITDTALARVHLKQGNILAYPTEAVFGLGCDPFNSSAVSRLLALKHRSAAKGLILLIADWSQLVPLIEPVSEALLTLVRATWPGPVTWIFPKSTLIPKEVSGAHSGIAIRMSAHPLVRALCADGPVISTSANVSGCQPALDLAGLLEQFPSGVDAVLLGDLGGFSQPSAIYDVLSGTRLR